MPAGGGVMDVEGDEVEPQAQPVRVRPAGTMRQVKAGSEGITWLVSARRPAAGTSRRRERLESEASRCGNIDHHRGRDRASCRSLRPRGVCRHARRDGLRLRRPPQPAALRRRLRPAAQDLDAAVSVCSSSRRTRPGGDGSDPRRLQDSDVVIDLASYGTSIYRPLRTEALKAGHASCA